MGEVKLTGMQQETYRLHFQENLTQEAIARRLRIKQPAVSRRLARIDARYRRAGRRPPLRPGRFLATRPLFSLSDQFNV